MNEEIIEQFYKHFCDFTDGGISVHFISSTLKNEDGTGVTLDDFINQAIAKKIDRLVDLEIFKTFQSHK